MAAAIYDPRFWKITWNKILITGFAPGSFIKVMRSTESATKVVGADGQVTFVMNPDRSGEVELTLRRESPVNTRLSAALNAMERGLAATGIGPFYAEQTNSSTTARGVTALIAKQPDLEGATDASPIVWRLLVDDISIFNGGADL